MTIAPPPPDWREQQETMRVDYEFACWIRHYWMQGRCQQPDGGWWPGTVEPTIPIWNPAHKH
jgi:hypothetical protein